MANDELVAINELLKRARLAAGMSQRDLARATGVSQPYLSTLERGQLVPTLPTLNRIAVATGHRLTITLSSAEPAASEPTTAETPSTETAFTEEGNSLSVTIQPPATILTDAERERREQLVAIAIHDAELEGGSVTPETQADLARYARGEIDSETLTRTVIARYDRR